MPNKFIAMLTVRRLLIFLQRGLPIRSIAAELSIGSKTVLAYKRLMKSSNKTYEELLALEDTALAEIMRPHHGKPKSKVQTENFKKNLEYYGPQRLELACKRALRTEKFSYKIIDNILANNQDKLESEASGSQQDMFPVVHENLRMQLFLLSFNQNFRRINISEILLMSICKYSIYRFTLRSFQTYI